MTFPDWKPFAGAAFVLLALFVLIEWASNRDTRPTMCHDGKLFRITHDNGDGTGTAEPVFDGPNHQKECL